MGVDQVVIVGGGCSGVLLAVEVLRSSSYRVVLVDPAARPGPGLAYGTASSVHLLNSPAWVMSAHGDDPAHFVEWCGRRGLPAGPGDFAPRRWYGEYLRDVLATAEQVAGSRLVRCRATAVRVFASEGGVLLDDGCRLPAAQVVLALGQPAPMDPPGVGPQVLGHRSYRHDPWVPDALPGLVPDEPVLVLGTGLTAVDVVLSLAAQSHRAPIVAVSRRGLLPARHEPQVPCEPAPVPAAQESLAALMRLVRRSVNAAADWRTVVDRLRPDVNAYWQALSPLAQERFVRHVARFWEVHRHRMAPPVADEVARLRRSGTFVVMAGQVRVDQADGHGFRVTLRRPDGQAVSARFGAIINCTGRGALTARPGPLVGALLRDGLARPGPHGLGLDVDSRGRLVGRDGQPTRPLWTLGPPRLGRLWETTAVPEIRQQARQLATDLSRPIMRTAVYAVPVGG